METISIPKLEHVANLRLIPGTPQDAGSTPHGKATWIEVTSGVLSTVNGNTIATIKPGGGDYLTRHVSDKTLGVDLHLLGHDASGTLFRFRASGYNYVTEEFMSVMDGNAPPESPPAEAPDLYGFEIIQVSTSSEEYWWLNFAVLVGQVKLVLGEKGIESVDYQLFKLTK